MDLQSKRRSLSLSLKKEKKNVPLSMSSAYGDKIVPAPNTEEASSSATKRTRQPITRLEYIDKDGRTIVLQSLHEESKRTWRPVDRLEAREDDLAIALLLSQEEARKNEARKQFSAEMDVDVPRVDSAGDHPKALQENDIANPADSILIPVEPNKPPGLRRVVSPSKQQSQEKPDSILVPNSQDGQGKGTENVKFLPDKQEAESSLLKKRKSEAGQRQESSDHGEAEQKDDDSSAALVCFSSDEDCIIGRSSPPKCYRAYTPSSWLVKLRVHPPADTAVALASEPRSHPRLRALDALVTAGLTYPDWEADVNEAERNHGGYPGLFRFDLARMQKKQAMHQGDRSHTQLRELDALMVSDLTYLGWEADVKEAERSHVGYPVFFDGLLAKIKKKQAISELKRKPEKAMLVAEPGSGGRAPEPRPSNLTQSEDVLLVSPLTLPSMTENGGQAGGQLARKRSTASTGSDEVLRSVSKKARGVGPETRTWELTSTSSEDSECLVEDGADNLKSDTLGTQPERRQQVSGLPERLNLNRLGGGGEQQRGGRCEGEWKGRLQDVWRKADATEALCRELKELRAELKGREAKLEERELEQDKRAVQLGQNEAALKEKESLLEKRGAEQDEREGQLGKKDAVLKDDEVKLEEKGEELEERRTDLFWREERTWRKGGQLEKKEIVLKERDTKLEERESKLEERESMLEEKRVDLEGREADQEKKSVEKVKREGQLVGFWSVLRERGDNLEVRESQLQERREKMKEREARMDQKGSQLGKKEAVLKERESKLEKKESVLEERGTKIEEREEEAQRQLKHAQEAFKTQQAEVVDLTTEDEGGGMRWQGEDGKEASDGERKVSGMALLSQVKQERDEAEEERHEEGMYSALFINRLQTEKDAILGEKCILQAQIDSVRALCVDRGIAASDVDAALLHPASKQRS